MRDVPQWPGWPMETLTPAVLLRENHQLKEEIVQLRAHLHRAEGVITRNQSMGIITQDEYK